MSLNVVLCVGVMLRNQSLTHSPVCHVDSFYDCQEATDPVVLLLLCQGSCLHERTAIQPVYTELHALSTVNCTSL